LKAAELQYRLKPHDVAFTNYDPLQHWFVHLRPTSYRMGATSIGVKNFLKTLFGAST
jgi:hypothetical protein